MNIGKTIIELESYTLDTGIGDMCSGALSVIASQAVTIAQLQLDNAKLRELADCAFSYINITNVDVEAHTISATLNEVYSVHEKIRTLYKSLSTPSQEALGETK